FERLVGLAPIVSNALGMTRQMNIWDFIRDAIDGTGGFADGAYLVPHKREFNKVTSSLVEKFWDRALLSDYDNFARTIAETPVSYIVEAKDLIQRKTDDPRLEAWWTNIDGEGTNMEDFLLGFPADQAQAYGTAWIFVDRPGVVETMKDDVDPANEAYVYCVPTRNVVYWEFDRDGEFSLIVVKEPEDDGSDDACAVRVWTPFAWGVFEPDPAPPGGTTTGSGGNAPGA